MYSSRSGWDLIASKTSSLSALAIMVAKSILLSLAPASAFFSTLIASVSFESDVLSTSSITFESALLIMAAVYSSFEFSSIFLAVSGEAF